MDKDYKKIEKILNNHSDKITNEFKEIKSKMESLEQKQEFNSMETTTIALFIAILIFSYTYISTTTPNDILSVFMSLFLIIVGLAIMFLIIMHIVAFYQKFDQFKKEFVFIFDSFILSFITLFILTSLVTAFVYTKIGLTAGEGDVGRITIIIIVIVEVLVTLLVSFIYIPKYLRDRFPKIFTQKWEYYRGIKKRNERKKPNQSIWKGHDSFNELKK